ncbi:MAG: carboxypeptidase regulatory-like domain-containing protein [Fidelibacterota bacterium]
MKRSVATGLPFVILFGVLTGLAAEGTIQGTIRYEGKIPKLRSFDMAIEPVCVMKHEEDPDAYPARSEALVLGDGNTMANIFVHVAQGLPERKWEVPGEPVTLDQDGCMYKPHVLGVMVGQPLKFLNSDGVLHNLHVLPEVNDEFNVTMPKFLKETVRTFDYAEPVFPIKCDVHPWMGGYIAVMDHPFFDVTEKDGVYTITGLQPGTYTVEAWHEKLGTRSATVTIEGDETKTVDFTFKR